VFKNVEVPVAAPLDKVHLSFGHDEYVFQVARNYLPEEGRFMLRYHSFYAAHRHGAYRHLMNQHDEEMFAWVRKFNPYDLYSKGRERPAGRPFFLFVRIRCPSFSPTKSTGNG
jgi:inositol oxygenase